MSIFALFDIGRSGISSSQRALAIASNNIANVNTPGYSRQDVVLKVANPIELNGDFIGRGVGDTDIRRTFDNFNYLQILGQSSSYGEAFALENGLTHVEQIFNESKEMGLMKFMEGYFNAWQDVSDNADDPAARTSLFREAEALVNSAKQIEKDLKNTIGFVNSEIGDVVNEINVLTQQISVANGKVQQTEAGGTESATTFRDERERLMKDLAKLIDFDWNEDSEGSVTIVAARRSLVAGVVSFDVDTTLQLNGDRDVYSDGTNITGYVQKGKLGGYIALRDDLKETALTGIRKLIASIVQETNDIHDDGYGIDGSTGNDFFDSLQLFKRDDTEGTSNATIVSASIYGGGDPNLLSLNEYDVVFSDATTYEVRYHDTGEVVAGTAGSTYTDGGDIDINSEITVVISGTPASKDTFFVSPLYNSIANFGLNITDIDQIAASDASTAMGANRSNNENANNIINAQQSTVTNLGDLTFDEFYGGIVSNIGSLSKAANDNLEFEDNLLYELESKRESVSGVSLDEEAANLIRYQRAYEAGARIIKITDELLELVINL